MNKTEITELLNKYGLSPLKKLGQNFLCDANIINGIVSAIPADETSNILEIGPGLGSLTRGLAKKAKRVVAVELDSGMVRVLSDTLRDYDNVTVIHADILSTDIDGIRREYFGGGDFHACGNLPYYITAKCLLKMCECGAKSVTAMVQKEVAERLAAAPGSRDYGAITASVAYYAVPNMLFTVSSRCFYPAPGVDSAVISIDLEKDVLPVKREHYSKVVRASFAKRRKTLQNNLTAAFPDMQKDELLSVLEKCGIPPQARAETLSPEDFCALASLLSAQREIPADTTRGGSTA